jgi:proline dehydrogenase
MSIINKAIVTLLPLVPKTLVGRFARPYIAGETLDAAVDKVRALTVEGCIATMDVLGEEVTRREETEAFTEQYLEVLDRIDSEKLHSNISIKPTALGLEIDLELCEANLRRLLTRASELNNFVRIDMEDSTTTTCTLDLYRKLKNDYDNVGVVLQSYLFRSMEDIQSLIPLGVSVRVCKGIYVEPKEIAYKNRQDIRNNFMDMVEALLTAGCYVGIATHDRQLIDRSVEMVRNLDLETDKYEFQMLLGVEANLRRQIIADGHAMRVYVPFGEHWYAYSTRRLKENPAVAGHVFKNIFAAR